MIDSFVFPDWAEFSKGNQPFLDNREYKGFQIQLQVTEELYLLIECQNDSFVQCSADNIIRFAWCNKAGFAVASIRYKYCEAGYLMGCAYLVNKAAEFGRFFLSFVENRAPEVRSRIRKYESEHPDS